jgi:hypothetical protein
MLFIFSTPVLIRHLWQLKTVVFLHWCLICGVLLIVFGLGCALGVLIRVQKLETVCKYLQFRSISLNLRVRQGETLKVGEYQNLNTDDVSKYQGGYPFDIYPSDHGFESRYWHHGPAS